MWPRTSASSRLDRRDRSTDKRAMEIEDIKAAAEQAGLAELFVQFPQEVATAVDLARDQAAAMRALPLDLDDAP